jgi:hypothetical protein
MIAHRPIFAIKYTTCGQNHEWNYGGNAPILFGLDIFGKKNLIAILLHGRGLAYRKEYV